MKKFTCLLLSVLVAAGMTALPAAAAEPIVVNEEITVSGDYDWTRFQG